LIWLRCALGILESAAGCCMGAGLCLMSNSPILACVVASLFIPAACLWVSVARAERDAARGGAV